MRERYAVWHTDKCYRFKLTAALSCAVHAFKVYNSKPLDAEYKANGANRDALLKAMRVYGNQYKHQRWSDV